MGEAVPSVCVGSVRLIRGSAGRGLQGGGGGRGLSGARGRGLEFPACCWRWRGFGGTVGGGRIIQSDKTVKTGKVIKSCKTEIEFVPCGFGPGSGGLLLLGGVTAVTGSSGGPVSLT